METKNAPKHVQEGANKNPNQFRRPLNPQQILQRDIKTNDDQKVTHPFQNNFVEEDQP